MDTLKNKSSLLAVIIIAIGSLSRLIPHMPNFTAMEGISLFAGAYLGSRLLKFLVPIGILFFTDFIINNTISRSFFPDHSGLVLFDTYMIFNIVGIVAVILLGSQFLKKVTAGRLAISVVSASMIFWIISNIGSWISLPIYTKDLLGLQQCFVAAIPFLYTSLISAAVFSTILFGAYELIKQYKFESDTAAA